MYIKHCKLSDKEQFRLLELFVEEYTARHAGQSLGIHRNSAIRFFNKVRYKIFEHQENIFQKMYGDIQNIKIQKKYNIYFYFNTKSKNIFIKKNPQLENMELIKIAAIKNISQFKELIKNKIEFHSNDIILQNKILDFWEKSKKNLAKYNGIDMHKIDLFLKECEWMFGSNNEGWLLEDLIKILKI